MREAESYAQQISRLLYAKTDEKERFVRWLTDHLAGRSFDTHFTEANSEKRLANSEKRRVSPENLDNRPEFCCR